MCERAHARQPINNFVWGERTPAPNVVSGNDTPVAMGQNLFYPIAVGTRENGQIVVGESTTRSYFSFTKYLPQVLSPGVSHVAKDYQWPPNAKGHRTAVAAAFFPPWPTARVWIYTTGTILNSAGEKRILTACITTEDQNLTNPPGDFTPLWSASEQADDLPAGSYEVPVAIYANESYVGVVGSAYSPGAGYGSVIYVYDAIGGQQVMKRMRWQSSPTNAADYPIGITQVSTYYGDPAVAIAVSVPDVHTPGTSTVALLGWQILDLSGYRPAKTPLVAAYLRKNLTGDTIDDDKGKAITQRPQTDTLGLADYAFAAVATRTFSSISHPENGLHTDIATEMFRVTSFSHTQDPVPGPNDAGALVEVWTRTWDFHLDDTPNQHVEDEDDAVGVCIHEGPSSGGNSIVNLAVAGVTKRPGDPYSRMVVIDYSSSTGVEQWYGIWQPDPLIPADWTGEFRPVAVRGGVLGYDQLGYAIPGLILPGFATPNDASPQNRNFAAACWSVPLDPGQQNPPQIAPYWAYHYDNIPLANSFDGEDTCTAAGIFQIFAPGENDWVFLTGRSASQSFSNDWVTLRVRPGP